MGLAILKTKINIMEEKTGCFIFTFVIAIMFTIAFGIITYSNVHTETITIKEKTISINSDDSYLIYTQDEVYKVRDMLFIGLFDASDVYNSMDVGKTYKVEVSGRRMPFFSKYKNIRKVKEIK